VVAVGGVRLLAELAERRFAFALDLVEALTDEGKSHRLFVLSLGAS
jgi:hypothetical protein